MHISLFFVSWFLKLFRIKCGKKCKFYGIPFIVKDKKSKITLGNEVTLISSSLSNLVGLSQRTIIVSRFGAEVIVGNQVGMSGVTIYASKKIEIGDHTIIGANTKILDHDFHPVDPKYRLENTNDREHTAEKEIVIGKNVFIGLNSLILKGVHIGDNSVVGAGSVVTKDVPANCVVAGNPAKVIKFLEDMQL